MPTQLQKLYQAIESLKELGVDLPDKLIEDTNRVEEEIIRNEIVPALASAINPVIEQIQRELILVVEYIPNEPLVVRMTRKRSMTFSGDQDDAIKILTLGGEKAPYTIPAHTKSSRTGLQVIFSDGTIVQEKFAYQTFIAAIQHMDLKKVEALGLSYCGVPLVGNQRDDFYGQHQLPSGKYVMTHSATRVKKEQLEEMARRLKLGIQVKIV